MKLLMIVIIGLIGSGVKGKPISPDEILDCSHVDEKDASKCLRRQHVLILDYLKSTEPRSSYETIDCTGVDAKDAADCIRRRHALLMDQIKLIRPRASYETVDCSVVEEQDIDDCRERRRFILLAELKALVTKDNEKVDHYGRSAPQNGALAKSSSA